MIRFDEAVSLVAEIAAPVDAEQVPLQAAHRRVLAAPVRARVDSPPADVSAMDGYAVRDVDLQALPSSLPIVGESFAGRPYPDSLPPGVCVRIFTGAAVPAGADRVVAQEVVVREGDSARFEQPLSSARHIRRAGSDFAVGEMLLDAGTLLTARALVAAAGADLPELAVARRPRVRLLSTGDELVEPGKASTTAGAIPESVSFGVAALVEEWGGEALGSTRLRDELPGMTAAAAEALANADLVVVTGGASVGEKDFAKAMFAPAGLELVFSKVAIKPGKPVWLGRASGKLVVGLPGNPTSALVTARLLLAPLLCGMLGRHPAEALRWRMLPLGHDVAPTGDRETFSRGVERNGSVELLGFQDSSAQKALAEAELLVRRAPGDEPLTAGTLVPVLAF